MRSRSLPYLAALASALSVALLVPDSAPALVRDTDPPAANPAAEPYALSLRVLLGPERTDLYLTVTSTGAPLPEVLGMVQVKVFAADGTHLRTDVYHDVGSPNGVAQIPLSGLERNQVLEVKAHAKNGNQNNLEARARVLLRPDLTIRRVTAPARVVRRHEFAVDAQIAELAGDTSATATVSLFEGNERKGSAAVVVDAGGGATVSFKLQFAVAGSHSFVLTVTGAEPAESDAANNSADASVRIAMYDADGVVATDDPLATQIGADVLADGGNAIDAAAAIQFALNVVQPQNSGIGGGSTIVVHLADGHGDFAIDARETAPAAATPDMYVKKGDFDTSGFAAGVPGTLRAVDTMLERWGTKSIADTLQPAIKLAVEGFPVGEALSRTSNNPRCKKIWPEAQALFCGLSRGQTLRQPVLAETFRLIASRGASVFYNGEIASAIVEAQHATRVAGGEGRMTLADLAAYDVVVRNPVFAHYRDYEVVSVPPSSCGGLVTLQALKMLRRFPLGDRAQGFGFMAPKTVHVMAEAMRLAFADRAFWIGDGPVPVDGLLSDGYTDQRSALIDPSKRMPRPPPGNPLAFEPTAESAEFQTGESALTSHFSVLDKWGNVVSFTTTHADAWGTGIMVPGYGFLLNDGLTNFNTAPQANSARKNPGMNDAGPGKRAMGNTAPTLLFKDGEPIVVTGSPGGAAIMSVVLDVLSNIVDHGMTLQEAVNAPRVWFNLSSISWNFGVPVETIEALRALGHTINPPLGPPQVGAAQSIAIDPATFTLSGAVDPRTPDAKFLIVAPG